MGKQPLPTPSFVLGEVEALRRIRRSTLLRANDGARW